jgi:glutaminyl-peptide cyclotransferase
MGIQSTELSGVEHLILLDLLGAPQPSIRSYFPDTTWLFDAMASAERRLGESGAFAYSDEKGTEPAQWKSYFSRQAISYFGYIGDDHVPFLQKGVSVLHIIPEPFPQVWHRLTVGHLIVVGGSTNLLH